MSAALGRGFAAFLSFLGKLAFKVNWQGWLGLALAGTLGVLLFLQKGETRHWTKEATRFEKLYRAEVTAHATDIASYKAAAEKAKQADAANVARVSQEQTAINQTRGSSYETRIADARARAGGLRSASPDHQGSSGTAPVPGVPSASGSASQGPLEDGLSDALTATEQAIQLDELIKWVKQQHTVDVNGK